MNVLKLIERFGRILYFSVPMLTRVLPIQMLKGSFHKNFTNFLTIQNFAKLNPKDEKLL